MVTSCFTRVRFLVFSKRTQLISNDLPRNQKLNNAIYCPPFVSMYIFGNFCIALTLSITVVMFLSQKVLLLVSTKQVG